MEITIELLQELSNRGFLIWKSDNEYYVLEKLATKADSRKAITDEEKLNTNYITFNSYYEAIGEAMNLVNWKQESKENKKDILFYWHADLFYNIGLGIQTQNLGEYPAECDKTAQEFGEQLAAKYFIGNSITKGKKFEDMQASVVIRPAQPPQ